MIFKAQFPEALYSPKTESSLMVYEKRIINGEKVMKSSNIVICGLARDIEQVFPYTKARIEQLQSMCKYCEIIIVENDSKDSTKRLLHKWSDENDYVNIISSDYGYEKLSDKSLSRRAIMAEQRNLYLQYVQESVIRKIDYLIVVDTDISGGFSYNGVANSFGFNQNWSCISGNSLIYRQVDGRLEGLFYDTWAKRNYGSWEETCGPEGNTTLYECGNEPVLMYSNFGGIAIYKYRDIEDLRYTEQDCDHVTLNRQLIEQGKNVYLNPSMITLQTPTYVCRSLCQ